MEMLTVSSDSSFYNMPFSGDYVIALGADSQKLLHLKEKRKEKNILTLGKIQKKFCGVGLVSLNFILWIGMLSVAIPSVEFWEEVKHFL